MKRFLAALQFLTIIPVKKAFDEKTVSRSHMWFPVVGVLLGFLIAGADWLFSYTHFPPLLTSLLVVFSLAILTGGFHLDGLADTADGFFSSRDREKMLAIMKDSRIGTMGVLALIMVLSIKVVALLGIPSKNRLFALILMPVIGRAFQLWFLGVGVYARPEGGIGSIFLNARKSYDRMWGLLWILVPLFFLFRLRGLVIAPILIAAGVLFYLWCIRKIGGITGDTIGAFTEISEALFLLLFSMLMTGWH